MSTAMRAERPIKTKAERRSSLERRVEFRLINIRNRRKKLRSRKRRLRGAKRKFF